MPKIVKHDPPLRPRFPEPSEKPEGTDAPMALAVVSETPPEVEETPSDTPAVLDTTLGNTKRRANKAAYSHDSTVVRHHADDYPTPRGFVEPLLEFLKLDTETRVMEPCAGGGHLVAVLREYFDHVYFEDLHYSGVDFLDATIPETPSPGWIITNPPYKHAEAFVRRSLLHADNVAMLLNSAFLESVTRSEGLFKDHPPAYVFMNNRRMRIEGGKSSVFAHVWVVWQKGRTDTRYRWLDVTGDKQMPTGHLASVWPDA